MYLAAELTQSVNGFLNNTLSPTPDTIKLSGQAHRPMELTEPA